LLIWIVGAIQVLTGLMMVFLVLLHSGRGGGLSDMFGGSLGANAAASNVMERNLDRITIVAALVYSFTVIGLALLLD
jgi:preprotein translocase subunit SecG